MRSSFFTLFNSFLVIILVGVFAFASMVAGISLTSAQTTATDQQAVSDREAQLRAALDQLVNEIAQQQAILDQEKQKGASLQRDISILNTQISLAQKKIQAHNIAIQSLGKDITTKTATIATLSDDIDKNKESLAQIMRKTNELDSYTLPEVILADADLSGFFQDLDSFDSLKQAMQVSYAQISQAKDQTEAEKEALYQKQVQEIDTKVSVQQEEDNIKAAETQKQSLLNLSKKEQQNYQLVINDQQKKAAAIRSALFALRDTSSIPFGKALEYANVASQKTGVRPAFILAILTQESNLGANTGSCYLTDPATGAGVGANTGTVFSHVMNPTRDVPVFQKILASLGRDPMNTRVSCPQSIGWGGAMGPAQFIPSTWDLMSDQIAAAVGTSVLDPWDPQTAITASAIYLENLGAAGGAYTAEKNAACKYFSGKSCSASSYGNTYGSQVIAKATTIQETMINPLQGN